MTFRCHCGLHIIQRRKGECRAILRDGTRCRDERSLPRSVRSAHLPNAWYAGWEHIDPDPDAPCYCGHPRHDGRCFLCAEPDVPHPYRGQAIEVGHIPEEEHMASHCKPTTAAITVALGRMHSGCELGDDVLLFNLLMQLEDREREVAEEELAALPDNFTTVMFALWRTAVAKRLAFTVQSEVPPKPLEWAREGRVSYRVDQDRESVTMFVAHVHGHHSEWMQDEAD